MFRVSEPHPGRIEGYMQKHSGVQFSHTICPSCAAEHYPEYVKD